MTKEEEVTIAKRDFYILLMLFLISFKRSGFYYSEIKKILGLKDSQMNRALKLLRKNFWIIPRVEPVKKGGRILVKYELSKRGKVFVELFPSVIRKFGGLKITK